jgi:hypothetical protein
MPVTKASEHGGQYLADHAVLMQTTLKLSGPRLHQRFVLLTAAMVRFRLLCTEVVCNNGFMTRLEMRSRRLSQKDRIDPLAMLLSTGMSVS